MRRLRTSLLLVMACAIGSMNFVGQCAGQVPAAPLDLTAQLSAPGDLAVSLFWTDDSSNEIGFEIQRAVGDSNVFQVIHLGTLGNVQSYNDVGLSETTKYTYRIRAYNNEGFSEFSNVASVTTGYARPNQVSNLQGGVIGGLASLSWVDESNNETKFEVQRAELGVSTSFEVIAVLPPNETSYLDATTLGGIVYTYRVVPFRFDVEGGAPLTVDIQTGDAIPGPSSFTARPKSRTSIQLEWKGRFGRDDKMHIQRFNLNTGFWESIAIPNASRRSYVDSGLTTGTTYLYRIRRATNLAVSTWQITSATTR